MLHYRDLLKQELKVRKILNPKYSLRLFAKDIRISPSQLSEVLSGKGGISTDKAKKLKVHLSSDPDVQDYFLNLVILEHGERKEDRERVKFF